MFDMYQSIQATVDVPQLKLLAGARGVIVDEYEKPYHAYEIEFLDAAGNTIGFISMKTDEITGISELRKAA